MNIAGLLSWLMLALAMLVVAGAIVILLRRTGPTERREPANYLSHVRLFSRNGRLFLFHGLGASLAFGVWGVLFNLCLLAQGFDVGFVGLFTLLDSASGAAMSIPAGLLADRVGRKLTFLVGNTIAVLVSFLAVSTSSAVLLLASALVLGASRPLFRTPRNAFITESSRQTERIHLFSVISGTGTAAGVVGSSLAGLVPLLALGDKSGAIAPTQTVALYRLVLYGGLVCWVLALVPLGMLRHIQLPSPAEKATHKSPGRLIFRNVTNPDRIWRLTLPSVLIGLGAGFTMPLLNVYFQQALGASEAAIGATLSAGQFALLMGMFLAPWAARRLGGKVKALVISRMLSLPFVLVLAFAPEVQSVVGPVFAIAALAHVARMGLMNMGLPLRAAFGTEILQPDERGTQVGIQQAIWGVVWGLSSYVGAQFMNSGNYRTPFMLMGLSYLAALSLFWHFFGGREHEMVATSTSYATSDWSVESQP